jgi:hypothetical protein
VRPLHFPFGQAFVSFETTNPILDSEFAVATMLNPETVQREDEGYASKAAYASRRGFVARHDRTFRVEN